MRGLMLFKTVELSLEPKPSDAFVPEVKSFEENSPNPVDIGRSTHSCSCNSPRRGHSEQRKRNY